MVKTAETVRPPLTSTEERVLKELVETLGKAQSQFCCGGTIHLPSERKLSLLYKGTHEEGQTHFGRYISPLKSIPVMKFPILII